MRQFKEVGKKLAGLIHYTLAWDEPLCSDEIEEILLAFKVELEILNDVM